MGYLCVYAVLLETTSRVFASPVSAQTLDAQGSRNFDGLDGMLERVNSIRVVYEVSLAVHALAVYSSFPDLVLEFCCVRFDMHKTSGSYRSEVVQ